MADGTKIEWTDATWNIVTGCAVVSPGCTNCYAMKLAGTRLRNLPSRAGLTRETKAGPVWTGEVRFNEGWLDQPLRWRQPRMIFVAAHGDLFAKGVTDAMLDRIFAVMAAASRHTFQVLTKRDKRMRAYLTAPDVVERIIAALRSLSAATPDPRHSRDPNADIGWNTWAAAENLTLGNDRSSWPKWPLANVWLGVSAEDQRRADERVPVLLDTPAAVRWVSAEPLLGPIDFAPWLEGEEKHGMVGNCIGWVPPLDWIVAGGESGHAARPMHANWARAIRDQCAAAGVPFLFKQHGAWASLEANDGSWPIDEANFCRLRADGSRGEDGWPLQRVGKKAAGRILDGVTHDGFPPCDEIIF